MEHNSYLHYICSGKRIKEGNEVVPFFFFKILGKQMMNGETALKAIEEFVAGITSKSGAVFPVEIKISPGNDVKVYLDADDGVTIEKCTSLNKVLYKFIEETGLFPDGNFSLEVSSSGVDEPLKLLRQYRKNIGRKVEVMTNKGAKTEGKLTNVTDEEITIEEKTGKGNKTTLSNRKIKFNEIKHTKVLITF